MRTILIGALTVMSSLGIHSAAQAATFFTAELSGDKIVPTPTGSLGTGFAEMMLNDDMTELTYSLTLNNLALDTDGGTVTKIHFHTGFSDEASPFHVLNIYGPSDDADAVFSNTSGPIVVSGKWTDADYCVTPPGVGFTCDNDPNTTKKLSDYLDDLLAGGLYMNIHTSDFPTGAIRGQIEVVPEPLTLLGAGTAIGFGTFFKRKKSDSKRK
ncbi:CHRD domain containing protein [Gloeothece citriformis PCC 7424]|uniref:CHRD domain containing protein n=1 Tax=Gloeothece citriformis (strain PCC 7424) TaxID=65393 RepID=B7KFD8_GLOC7|nr:PEP-CTERM sorting domain-containing protein [Gloeothece citriformis]ACK71854.1 CHRD domain containing protein [Gloeothece citriformis PCC 7424]